jgi:hypothetical protein
MRAEPTIPNVSIGAMRQQNVGSHPLTKAHSP